MRTRNTPSTSSLALQKIREAGPYKVHKLPHDTKVIVLPSCTVPTKYLYPDNWDETSDGGNFREVVWIIGACGRKFRGKLENTLFAKSPEETFVGEESCIRAGKVWWGGTRSEHRDNYINLQDEPAVGELGYWEAAYLTTLWKEGIPAEEPQAIIDTHNGQYVRVVTKGINNASHWWHSGEPSKKPVTGADKELERRVRALGIEPEDFQTLCDVDGKTWVIDAARWFWPSHTDCVRKKLRNLLLQRAQQKRAAAGSILRP